MQRSAKFASAAFLVVVLVAILGVLSPVALARGTAAKGTPVVVGVVPDPNGDRSNWTGDQVNVNYVLSGGELDTDKCRLFIDGKVKSTDSIDVQYLTPKSPTLVYSWSDSKLGAGTHDFKVELVTTKGKVVTHTWTFTSEGEATGGQLVNVGIMKKWFWYIAAGSLLTVELTIISIVLACILALVGALGRLSKKMTFKQGWQRYRSRSYMLKMVLGRFPYWIATFYTSLFRGTPLLLQIMILYLASPEVVKAFGWPSSYNPSPFICGVAALSLNYGAYLTEVFRAGIQAVPKGQNEAAWALGLSGWQTQRRIILPQAFKIVIPAVGNDFIALIKDTSLVSVITVEELLRRSQLAGASSMNNFSTLLVAAAFYWALTIFFSFWQSRLEKRMARDRARG